MGATSVHALWIGGELGLLEHICLSSFLKAGHAVVLHAYENTRNVPAGVTLFDANRLICADKIFTHAKTGSYALFSDVYRYKVLKNFDCYWVDTDVFCLRAFEVPNSHVFGWEDKKYIGSAVLRMPTDSPVLAELIALSEDPYFIPPWLPFHERWAQGGRKFLGRARSITQQRWGTLGPKALTHCAKKYNFDQFALQRDVFYPVHWTEARSLFETGFKFDQVINENTRAVHFWNEMVKNFKTRTPVHGSFFHYAASLCNAL